MAKISVIIPIYNVEKYLKECIDSVINQTFSDIEIICVNDGSTDSSLTILEKYAQKDSRIKIINQENKGLSEARNTGLLHSKGDYVFFLDSDDYINNSILEKLFSEAISTNSDIICSDTIVFADDANNQRVLEATKSLKKYFASKNVFKTKQITIDNISDGFEDFTVVVWGKLFLRKFLKENTITFPNNRLIHEDDCFWLKTLACFPRISTITDIGVYYRIRANSIITSQEKNVNIKEMRAILKDAFRFIKNKKPEQYGNLIKKIKYSNKYCQCFEKGIKGFFLYRWGLNNKKIKLIGLSLYKQQQRGNTIITKTLGINIKKEYVMPKCEMNIFFASDDKFCQHLCVTIASILKNSNSNDLFNFYILDDSISQKNKSKLLKLNKIKPFNIEFISVDNNLFKNCPQSKFCPQITKQTYYRYIIPTIKPNLKKVLYLDCDIVVLGSLRELWNTELKDKWCGAIQGLKTEESNLKDTSRLKLTKTFNAGVLLINNEKWVKENVSEKLFNITESLHKNNNLLLQDQDALNVCFQENIIWLHPKFNYQQTLTKNMNFLIYSQEDLIESKKKPIIVHYNSEKKPWNSNMNFYKKEYLKYLFLSKYYKEYLKILISKSINLKAFLEIKNQKKHKLIKFLGIKFKFSKTKIFNFIFVSKFIQKKYNYINKNFNNNFPYGLLIYTYTSNCEKYYKTGNIVNIGDYIQSLAAKQFLNGDDSHLILIDRDNINFYDSKNVNMIMNGWYHICSSNNNISEKINPLYIAFHINNTQDVSEETLKSLKKYEPIGCRDYATRDFLLSNKIKAYFSSCLTTTLDIKYKKEAINRKGIIFCDYTPEKKLTKIDKAVAKVIKRYGNPEIEKTTHLYDLNLSHKERFQIAEELIKKYAKAELVITSRIHCALPCLALGTPVILISKKYDKARYKGIFEFFNVIGYSKNKIFITNIKYNKEKKVINKCNYKIHAENLKNKVREWQNSQLNS